jgi:alpha-glucosidase
MTALILIFVSQASAQQLVTTGPNDPIQKPSGALNYNGFYTKMVKFQNLPILASDKVEDRALRRIVDTFSKMLANAPSGTVQALVDADCHYSIIAEEEGQTDLPEYANLRNDPKTDWNKRARGLGGKVTSGGEENILEISSDRYFGESIYIHEFAHTLDRYGFSKTVFNFRTRLREAYDAAMKDQLWKNTYAATNAAEYWAEGVQSYFDCNRAATPPNGIHNEICNREGLEKYDPRLYKLLDEAFGKNPWRYEGKYNTTKGPVSRKSTEIEKL